MIATILLLPHAETRERLLAPGVLMAEPADRVWLTSWSCRKWGETVALGEDGVLRPVPEKAHLVLARSGAEVYEGTDRAGRVSGALVHGVEARVRAASLSFEVAVLLGHEPSMNRTVAMERLRSIVTPLGDLLLLDEKGEVANAERAHPFGVH